MMSTVALLTQGLRACHPSPRLDKTFCQPGQAVAELAQCWQALPAVAVAHAQLPLFRLKRMTLQVPVQRLLGLHCARLVAQPPEVPVSDPLQRLGVGRLPARQQPAGAHLASTPFTLRPIRR